MVYRFMVFWNDKGIVLLQYQVSHLYATQNIFYELPKLKSEL